MMKRFFVAAGAALLIGGFVSSASAQTIPTTQAVVRQICQASGSQGCSIAIAQYLTSLPPAARPAAQAALADLGANDIDITTLPGGIDGPGSPA